MRALRLMLLAAAGVPVSGTAMACPTLAPEVAQRTAAARAMDRRVAAVVVIGTWRDLSAGDQHCGDMGEEGPCRASIVAELVERGERLAGYPVHYDRAINLCDIRSLAPEDGTYGRFYLARASDGSGFGLVEFAAADRK